MLTIASSCMRSYREFCKMETYLIVCKFVYLQKIILSDKCDGL